MRIVVGVAWWVEHDQALRQPGGRVHPEQRDARAGGQERARARTDIARADDVHTRVRRVVVLERSRSRDVAAIEHRDRVAEHAFDLVWRHTTESRDHGFVARAVDDRALDTDAARTTVEHDVDIVSEIGAYIGGGGRAHATEAVGGWRRDPTTERSEQRVCERLSGDAQAHRVTPTGDGVGYACRPWDDHGEGSRPERMRERARRRRD